MLQLDWDLRDVPGGGGSEGGFVGWPCCDVRCVCDAYMVDAVLMRVGSDSITNLDGVLEARGREGVRWRYRDA